MGPGGAATDNNDALKRMDFRFHVHTAGFSGQSRGKCQLVSYNHSHTLRTNGPVHASASGSEFTIGFQYEFETNEMLARAAHKKFILAASERAYRPAYL